MKTKNNPATRRVPWSGDSAATCVVKLVLSSPSVIVRISYSQSPLVGRLCADVRSKVGIIFSIRHCPHQLFAESPGRETLRRRA